MKEFKYWLILWAVLVTWLICAIGCQSKKKALSIQKSTVSEQVEVKKDVVETVKDQSISTVINTDKSQTVTLQEWFNPDTAKGSVKYRKTVFQINDVKKTEDLQADINKSSSVKIDSVFNKETSTKSKIQDKEVKDNLTSKVIGIGFLFLIILISVVYIRYQIRKNKTLKGLIS